MSTEIDHKNWQIKLGKNTATIPSLALLLMIGGILFPAVYYSLHLTDPTPASVLVAICVSLFSSVIYLWILDATGILIFRKEWISKSIYGAAIVSVLGTSVAVYKDYFEQDKYPLQGIWKFTTIDKNKNISFENELLLSFSKNSSVYFGFSNHTSALADSTAISSVEVSQLSPKEKFIVFKIINGKGLTETFRKIITTSDNEKQILLSIDSTDKYTYIISRPN